MKINDFAKQSGTHLETIRYYEKIGLLPEPQRAANGYRIYNEKSLLLLSFIKTCRSLGFSIDDIKQLQELKNQPTQYCQADQMIIRHVASINEKINQLMSIKENLTSLINEREHRVDECRVISRLDK